jgi:hypothetical protein
MAWDGFDADTRDTLLGVNADARESFYRPSTLRRLLSIFAIMVSLALVTLGLYAEKPLGYFIMLAGVIGLELSAYGLACRS